MGVCKQCWNILFPGLFRYNLIGGEGWETRQNSCKLRHGFVSCLCIKIRLCKGRTIIFLEEGYKKYCKNLFAGSEKTKLIVYKRDKVKQMFAEKSGKILKDIFTKTEIKK